MAGWLQQWQALRTRFRELTPAELASRLGDESDLVLLDVREAEELQSEGWVAGSLHLPYGRVAAEVQQRIPARDAPIITICAHGQRSLFILAVLEELGYTNLASLAGGLAAWAESGYAVESTGGLDSLQRERYARHLALPDVGLAGQRRLLESRVLVVGAGGLGSPSALYLAAAGVGTVGIVDSDVVESSNLHRQLLHSPAQLGERKVDSAKQRLEAANPDVTVRAHDTRVEEENVDALVADYDVVLDGSDNFETRYLLNDACIAAGIPLVHGSVYRFEGQITVFAPPEGPCYRCLHPAPPPSDLFLNCTQQGVLGVLPGLIGMLQATETLKLLLHLGKPLLGRLLCYDAMSATFQELALPRNPACASCGDLAE